MQKIPKIKKFVKFEGYKKCENGTKNVRNLIVYEEEKRRGKTE